MNMFRVLLEIFPELFYFYPCVHMSHVQYEGQQETCGNCHPASSHSAACKSTRHSVTGWGLLQDPVTFNSLLKDSVTSIINVDPHEIIHTSCLFAKARKNIRELSMIGSIDEVNLGAYNGLYLSRNQP